MLAVDAKTGKVLWHFNTVPQDEKDQGWDVAGPTWVGGERNGGGIWETPAIDPELGTALRRRRQSVRRQQRSAPASNLFTDSIVALTLRYGPARSGTSSRRTTTCGTTTRARRRFCSTCRCGGRRVKALAEASKNGFLYILDRETGKPVHPIKEMPVPTDDARPGESPWPTQPIPFTAGGKPMEPVCPIDAARHSRRSSSRRTRSCRYFARRRPNQIMRAGHRRRRELQPAVLQPADGSPVRQRRSISRSTAGDAARKAISPPTTRRPAS